MRARRLLACAGLLALACARTGPSKPAASVVGSAPPPLPGATCQKQTGGDDAAAMFLTDVVISGELGYDRVEFTFVPREGQQSKVPHYTFETAKPPLTQDGSGEEITVAGSAFIHGSMWASGVDLGADEVKEIYTGPKKLTPDDTAQVSEVRNAGDFENVLTWYVGTKSRACFKASTLDDPVRIILDVEAGVRSVAE